MKFKKTFAAMAAAALAASAMSVTSVSAISNSTVVDFEDGDCSFVYINNYDGGSNCAVSVDTYNGSKALKVDPEDCSLWPKIWFDLDKMLPREKLVTVKTIEMDISLVPDEGGVVGWCAGYIAGAGGFDPTNIQPSQTKPGWDQAEVNLGGGAYDPDVAATGHGKRTILLPAKRYSLEGTNPFMAVMINRPFTEAGATDDYTIYIDNITFTDVDGNAINFGVEEAAAETEAPAETEAAAPAETEAAAPAETETEAAAPAEETADAPAAAETEAAAPAETQAAAPAETTAAPVADTTTSAPAQTGNAAVASIAAVMALAGAAVVASKRK